MLRNEYFNRMKKEKEWKRNIGAKEKMALDTNVIVVESQTTMWIEKRGRWGEI